jgi:low affinity Fe/Cu permease
VAVRAEHALGQRRCRKTMGADMSKLAHWFMKFAKWASWSTGHPVAFVVAVAVVAVWAVTGPLFGYSDTWQLVINTGTTIVTFLMVFLIQNTQNRDTAAIQIKLDELIRSVEGAENSLLDMEEMEDCDLERIRQGYEELAAAARRELRKKDRPNSDRSHAADPPPIVASQSA